VVVSKVAVSKVAVKQGGQGGGGQRKYQPSIMARSLKGAGELREMANSALRNFSEACRAESERLNFGPQAVLISLRGTLSG